ncbi:MAG: hypothetical protein WDW38_008308 [Sanguina aurantia]
MTVDMHVATVGHEHSAMDSHEKLGGSLAGKDSQHDIYFDADARSSDTRSSRSSAHGMRSLVPQEQQDIVRAALKGESECCDDETLCRFIRATGGNLPLTIKRLLHTLKWRREFEPTQAVCPACTKNTRSHYMHVAAFDKVKRPTIYSCLALAHNRNIHDSYTHLVQQFELATALMIPGVSDSWVWICDFQGFGLVDCDPRMAKIFLSMSSEHYPERLGLFLIVGAPMMFNILWKAISPFIDPKTFRKIRFLPMDYNAAKPTKPCQVKAELALHYEPASVEWLLTEMTENRDRKITPTKTFSVPALYTHAMAGTLSPTPGHDPRGTNDILAAFARLPHLLQPQGEAKP